MLIFFYDFMKYSLKSLLEHILSKNENKNWSYCCCFFMNYQQYSTRKMTLELIQSKLWMIQELWTRPFTLDQLVTSTLSMILLLFGRKKLENLLRKSMFLRNKSWRTSKVCIRFFLLLWNLSYLSSQTFELSNYLTYDNTSKLIIVFQMSTILMGSFSRRDSVYKTI